MTQTDAEVSRLWDALVAGGWTPPTTPSDAISAYLATLTKSSPVEAVAVKGATDKPAEGLEIFIADLRTRSKWHADRHNVQDAIRLQRAASYLELAHHCIDQLHGPLSVAALTSRAERAEAALAPLSNPEAPAAPENAIIWIKNAMANKDFSPVVAEKGRACVEALKAALVATPPAPPSARTAAWLIERNNGEQPWSWYAENEDDGWHWWTTTAHEAKRFASRAEAEAFPAYQMIASDPTISITEHVFLGSDAPAPTAQEMDSLLEADPIMAHAASVICGAACGDYSHCKSREAAKALRDAGLLAPAPTSAVDGEAEKIGIIERLERAKTDFWAHTRMDCLSDAVEAITALVKERDNLESVLRAKPTGTAAQRERQWEKRVATLEAALSAQAVPAAMGGVEEGSIDLATAILKQLTTLSVGSCSCGVKSPDIHWHDACCRYRLVEEIRENVEALEEQRADQWRKRRDAEGSRDVANAAYDSLRIETNRSAKRRDCAPCRGMFITVAFAQDGGTIQQDVRPDAEGLRGFSGAWSCRPRSPSPSRCWRGGKAVSDLFALQSSAVFSACGLYRHRLDREVQAEGIVILYSGVNGSTAGAQAEDQTTMKWRGFTLRNNGRKYIAVNPFGKTATDPRELAKVADPVGPDNARHVLEAIAEADILVPCWGSRDKLPQRLWHHLDAMRDLFFASGKPVKVFGFTKSGDPKHPLMLGYDTPLVDWSGRSALTMSATLIERLRARANFFDDLREFDAPSGAIEREAAAHIESLEQRLVRAEAALAFADKQSTKAEALLEPHVAWNEAD